LAILVLAQAGHLFRGVSARTNEQNENTGYLGWKMLRVNMALIFLVLVASLSLGWMRNHQIEHDRQMESLIDRLDELTHVMQPDETTTASAER
jgi:hypothetical protein